MSGILLGNDNLPGDLQRQPDAVADRHKLGRCRASTQSLTAASVSLGRGQSILKRRERIKWRTLEARRMYQRMTVT